MLEILASPSQTHFSDSDVHLVDPVIRSDEPRCFGLERSLAEQIPAQMRLWEN